MGARGRRRRCPARLDSVSARLKALNVSLLLRFMPNRKHHRNHQIISLHERGAPLASLAKQFGISEGRTRQIIEVHGPLESLKDELRATYGDRPDLYALADETPIDVLLLHDTDDFSWESLLRRWRSFEIPIHTLGDLRRTPKRRLRALPRIGPHTFETLNALCARPRGSKQRKSN